MREPVLRFVVVICLALLIYMPADARAQGEESVQQDAEYAKVLEENPDEFLVQHQDPAVTALTGAKPEAHQVNLADDPAYADKRKELEGLLLEEMKKWGDPYRLWDQPPLDQPSLDESPGGQTPAE